MAKRCTLSTENLLRGGLARNSVDRITDHSDMTSAVYLGRKASTQTNKQNLTLLSETCCITLLQATSVSDKHN